jgi:starch synthase
VNILYVTSEVARYAKTGGLADVSAALPAFLLGAGHDVRIFLPYYAQLDLRGASVEPVLRDVEIRLGNRQYEVAILRASRPGDAPVHLVHCPALYHRAALYTGDPDEHLRFLVLTRAALESCGRLQFAPDVIHANDWQAALAPLTRRSATRGTGCSRTRTLLAIHNFNYQGTFAPTPSPTPAGRRRAPVPPDQLREGRINPAPRHPHADGIVTVSPLRARDPGRGARVLAHRSCARGHRPWSASSTASTTPSGRSADPARYSADRPGATARRWSSGSPPRAASPVIGRVAARRPEGLALSTTSPRLFRRHGFQLVVLGSGEPRLGAVRGPWRRSRARSGSTAGSPTSRPPDRGRRRHVPDAVALRAVRAQPDVQPVMAPCRSCTGPAGWPISESGTRATAPNGAFEHFTAEGLRWASSRRRAVPRPRAWRR